MPAVTPAEVQTGPSRTKIGSGSTRTAGKRRASSAQNDQWVAARRPSSKPVAASRTAPVQTEATRRAWPARVRAQSTSTGSAAAAVTPGPPAMISVSSAASAGGSGSAASPSPAEAVTLVPPPSPQAPRPGSHRAAFPADFPAASPGPATKSLAEANTWSGPATSSSCTDGKASSFDRAGRGFGGERGVIWHFRHILPG